jgi:FkbM family methyltransferase
MRVVDIGANIGFLSMLAASRVGSTGRVLAVEPNPSNGRLLMASRAANRFEHIDLLMTAAGQNLLPMALYVESSNGQVGDAGESAEAILQASELVPVVRLDPILANWGSVDFVKIDIEGAEHMALGGCIEMLRRHHPIILSEFCPPALAHVSGSSGIAYLRFLLDLGYSLAVVGPDQTPVTTRDPDMILEAYRQQSSDHIDILAVPE